MANHGPSYGLSRELERKNQARFNVDEAHEVLAWIEAALGRAQFEREPAEHTTSDEVADALKDGVALCLLMNRILMGSNNNGGALPPLKFHKEPRMPFHKMENIAGFLEACKRYGVPQISCFQTVDLYENKQCYKVIECLRALAAVAQGKRAAIPFPHWVIRMSSSSMAAAAAGGGGAKHSQYQQLQRLKQQKHQSGGDGHFSIGGGAGGGGAGGGGAGGGDGMLANNSVEAVIPLQYGTNKCASQKGMTPYGLPRQIKQPDSAAAAAIIH